MHGVQRDFDISSFIGMEIQGIFLGQYMLSLTIHENISISCEGTVEISKNDTKITIRTHDKWGDINPLTEIMNIKITEGSIESEDSFSLTLDNGTKIIFIDDSKEYESFQIRDYEKFIVI